MACRHKNLAPEFATVGQTLIWKGFCLDCGQELGGGETSDPMAIELEWYVDQTKA